MNSPRPSNCVILSQCDQSHFHQVSLSSAQKLDCQHNKNVAHNMDQHILSKRELLDMDYLYVSNATQHFIFSHKFHRVKLDILVLKVR